MSHDYEIIQLRKGINNIRIFIENLKIFINRIYITKLFRYFVDDSIKLFYCGCCCCCSGERCVSDERCVSVERCVSWGSCLVYCRFYSHRMGQLRVKAQFKFKTMKSVTDLILLCMI